MFKSIGIAFILVFLAELGDKTQLSTMMLASKSGSRMFTFIGSSLALIFSSFLGVMLGGTIEKHIPSNYIQFISGIAFLIIGTLLILGKL